MADVTPLGRGRFLVVDGGRQRVAYAVAAGTMRWVFIDGVTYVLGGEPGGAGRRTHATDDALDLAAPMPATVVIVNVSPGQQVAAGDVLIVLEAMKMELPVRAPRDGAVTAVNCQVGELVQPGAPLLDLA